jgi:hypothetical protein
VSLIISVPGTPKAASTSSSSSRIEKAIANAKRMLIHDHVDNCLEAVAGPAGAALGNDMIGDEPPQSFRGT